VTGPEHYAAAEEILSRSGQDAPGSPLMLASLARAQVHATLACAAATAIGDRDFRTWLEKAGPPLAGALRGSGPAGPHRCLWRIILDIDSSRSVVPPEEAHSFASIPVQSGLLTLLEMFRTSRASPQSRLAQGDMSALSGRSAGHRHALMTTCLVRRI
jgi:hypothetical protein